MRLFGRIHREKLRKSEKGRKVMGNSNIYLFNSQCQPQPVFASGNSTKDKPILTGGKRTTTTTTPIIPTKTEKPILEPQATTEAKREKKTTTTPVADVDQLNET